MNNKILFYHEAYEIGGDSIYLQNLLASFNSDEYIFLLNGSNEAFKFFKNAGFNTIKLKYFYRHRSVKYINEHFRWKLVRAVLFRLDFYLLHPFMLFMWPIRIKRIINKYYPTCSTLVINAGGFPPYLLAPLLKNFNGSKYCILHNHVPDFITPEDPLCMLFRTYFERWIVGSCVIVKQLKERCGIPDEKISMVRYGIPIAHSFTTEDRMRVREKLGIADDTFVVLHPSVFHERKGHSFTINGFADFKKNHANSKLIIAGNGEDVNYINRTKTLIKDLRLENDILFTGFYSPIEELVFASDALCLPSQEYDTTPFVILTALAYGIPVITTIRPDFENILNDNNAFLVPLNNAKQITNKLSFIADNPAVAHDIANNGILAFKNYFSFEKMLSETKKLICGEKN